MTRDTRYLRGKVRRDDGALSNDCIGEGPPGRRGSGEACWGSMSIALVNAIDELAVHQGLHEHEFTLSLDVPLAKGLDLLGGRWRRSENIDNLALQVDAHEGAHLCHTHTQ